MALSVTLPTTGLSFTFDDLAKTLETDAQRCQRIEDFYASEEEDNLDENGRPYPPSEADVFPPRPPPVVQPRPPRQDRLWRQLRIHGSRERVARARRRYAQEEVDTMLAWYRSKLQVILSSRDPKECHEAADALAALDPEKADLLGKLLYD